MLTYVTKLVGQKFINGLEKSQVELCLMPLYSISLGDPQPHGESRGNLALCSVCETWLLGFDRLAFYLRATLESNNGKDQDVSTCIDE
jgi:hypothetical protein